MTLGFLNIAKFNFLKGNEECTSVIVKPHPIISSPISLHHPVIFTDTILLEILNFVGSLTI